MTPLESLLTQSADLVAPIADSGLKPTLVRARGEMRQRELLRRQLLACAIAPPPRPTPLLPGAFHIMLSRFADARGAFVKTYTASMFAALGLGFERRESFYSTSRRGVIRGMHFQRSPHDHDKIVHCASGRSLDVLLDLRPGPGFGRMRSVLLDAAQPSIVFIPKGIAHGFKALTDDTTMVYDTSSEHAPAHDGGVRWDSFGFDWDLGQELPVISERDRHHPGLAELRNPLNSAEPVA